MNMLLLAFGIFVFGSLLLFFSVACYYWRYTLRYRKQVVATIKHIQVWLDGWYVTAVWTDVVKNRSYIFQSQRIEYDFKQRVGDRVIVHIDPKNPDRYAMKI
jgi:hypothetical protein